MNAAVGANTIKGRKLSGPTLTWGFHERSTEIYRFPGNDGVWKKDRALKVIDSMMIPSAR